MTDDRADLVAWFHALPMIRMLGIRCVGLTATGGEFEVDVRDDHRNPGGNVSGAVTAGAVDLAAGLAVSAATGRDAVTGNLGLSYLAPARTAPLRIEVELLKSGGRTCVPHVRLYDASDRLCVVGTGTWFLGATGPWESQAAEVEAHQGCRSVDSQTVGC